MKNPLLLFALVGTLLLPQFASADGPSDEPKPVRRNYRGAKAIEEAPPPAAPICIPKSESPKVKILSWNPTQKVSKFLGEIQECVTTQWDVLRLLSGPNAISLRYPEERETWGYLWLWRYKLQNPIGDTLIMMDKPGKRLMKGKNPVELYLTFNENDVVERIDMALIKKKNSQYVLFP